MTLLPPCLPILFCLLGVYGAQTLFKRLWSLSSVHQPLLTGIRYESLLNYREKGLHFSHTPAEIKFFFFECLKKNRKLFVFMSSAAPPNVTLSSLIHLLYLLSSFSNLRCIWANDGVCEPGEPPLPADL